MKAYYTVKNAVIDVLWEIPYDVKFTTQEFYRRVITALKEKECNANPMEESVSRIFRMHKHDFDVILVKHGQATWIKHRQL